MLNSGEIVKGRVHQVETFGLYLEYQKNNLFVRIIDVSWEPREAIGLLESTKIGDEITVKILHVIKEYNIYLASIKDVHPEKNPWKEPQIYKKGKVFSGTIDRIVEYGFLVILETGALGLIYKEDLTTSLKEKEAVQVSILEADVERQRIRLKLL
jgi:small subunit ribosomal protein S1